MADNPRRRNKTFVSVDIEKSLVVNMDKYQEIINSTFGKLNTLIPLIDGLIEKRLSGYEDEMLKVMKDQIAKMQDDIKRVVYQYNEMIRAKNRDEVLFQTRNNLQFYKTQGLRLHSQNIQLRSQIQRLKNVIKQNHLDIQNTSETLKSVTRKYLKFKQRHQPNLSQVHVSKPTKTEQDRYNTTDNWLVTKHRKLKSSNTLKGYQETMDNGSFITKLNKHSVSKR